MDPGRCEDRILVSYNSTDGDQLVIVQSATTLFLPSHVSSITLQTCERQDVTKYDLASFHLNIFEIGPTFRLNTIASKVGEYNCTINFVFINYQYTTLNNIFLPISLLKLS